jgi:hypothetical protein
VQFAAMRPGQKDRENGSAKTSTLTSHDAGRRERSRGVIVDRPLLS